MSDETLTPEIIRELPLKQAAFAILKEQGLNTQEAGKALGYTKQTAYHVNSKIQKSILTSRKMVKSAASIVKDVLDMKPLEVKQDVLNSDGQKVELTNRVYPTHSNALVAAAMVFDRSEPKVNRNENLNIDVSISPVDYERLREKYRK